MPKTLIIDDDPDFLAMARRAMQGPLRASGHHFLFAASDDEALACLRAEAGLDLVLVSLDSGAISGLALFRRLQGIRLRVPRIALTRQADVAVIRQAIHDGAADFLVKPVSGADLVATLDKVFADCQGRRNAWSAAAELSAVRREIEVAGDLQKRILPADFAHHPHLQVAAAIQPARQMSGDFYDYFELSPGRIALVVADVSGKGIPAAFYMAVARTLIRSTALRDDGPAACLAHVNAVLCRHDIPNMFVSVFYGVLDTQTWRIDYANAGHLPPYHIRAANGAVTRLEGGEGVVLGVTETEPYDQASLVLEPGDALFFYTDGLVEAFDVERNQFSDERLIGYLADNRDRTAHALAEDVFAFVNAFTGEAERSDDITSLVIKRFG
ncbi:MAG: SpoIIE family protein phosphatase [Rhodospirillales bacterium]|nr:SpoIIE family protein phosphatase [Rhodospirillales bacterium]